jgi:hypothetical protein
MFKKISITCDEATTICDKNQYKEATLSQKLRLNWHFVHCKICRLYTNQNNKMTRLFSMKVSDCKQHKNCLSKADKDKLSVEFNKMKA